MRMETVVMMVVMVGFIFATVGLIINDLKTQYPDVEINATWEHKYDYSSKINESASKIVNYFDKIGEREGGWQVITGIVAMPLAVIEAVKIMTLSLVSGVKIATGLGTEAGLDPTIISFIIIIITIVVVFVLIRFWRKTEPPV